VFSLLVRRCLKEGGKRGKNILKFLLRLLSRLSPSNIHGYFCVGLGREQSRICRLECATPSSVANPQHLLRDYFGTRGIANLLNLLTGSDGLPVCLAAIF